MSKIIIIGIDGLDPFLLYRWKDDLPNLGNLFKDVSEITIDSTFPPDSICAWASIYTGENPAEHGLLESIDYLSSRKLSNNEDRSIHFKGKTFWDIAAKNGKTVCVINPFLAYPAWEVNGVMVSGPVFEGGKISAYPAGVSNEYNFPPLGGIVDFPDEKHLSEFIINTIKATEDLAEASLNLYKDRRPDLFFLAFLTLDRIKHFLWKYTDKNDMYYPGDTEFKNTIKDFYIIFDTIIGRFVNLLDDDTSLMIISDHGHRRRCSKCLNLNEILRKKGYISISSSGAKGLLRILIERAKVETIAAMTRYGFQDWIYKVAKFIPNRKALKKSTYLIDNEGSAVTLSNLCGTNPHGGIDIRAASGKEYEKLREAIINELMDLNKTHGGNIVRWARKREDMYRGKYENRLPDVLFELDDEYGVGMDFFTSDITTNYTHKKISGGHKPEAVLLVSDNNGTIKDVPRPSSALGVCEYILKILDR